MRATISLSIAALFIAACSIAPANAQSDASQKVEARLMAATKKIQDACGGDVAKFCSAVSPGEGRLILCMMAHEDKISTKCDYAIYEATRNLERALDRLEETADACWTDIEKHCASVPEGSGRIAQCLVAKKASLSTQCTTAIDKFPVAK